MALPVPGGVASPGETIKPTVFTERKSRNNLGDNAKTINQKKMSIFYGYWKSNWSFRNETWNRSMNKEITQKDLELQEENMKAERE